VAARWTRAAIDRERLQFEQRALADVWTFLGLTTDLRNDADWFVASLATRLVCVQRTRSGIRGFENVCAHRPYPLRAAVQGNGPIICPYRHWHYDDEGRAIGVPKCRELFGSVPVELNARLRPVEVAICGTSIFGASKLGSLKDYLGDAFPVLEAMSPDSGHAKRMMEDAEESWRFCFHLTLDDYHAVAVHPTTLGKRGYLRRDEITYVRIGLHSVFIYDADCNCLEKMVTTCREGSFQFSTYSISHIFPNLLVVHLPADAGHWRCSIQQYVPITGSRSTFRAWTYLAPFVTSRSKFRRLRDCVAEPIRSHIFQHYLKLAVCEDLRIRENLQKVADQMVGAPRLGRLEERIEWFEEAYRSICVD
jgi:phenylpropionate dioxygenase-like ring-hydroxylating dioxygenase large terminal subunit